MHNHMNPLMTCRILAVRHLRRPVFYLILVPALLIQYILGSLVFPSLQNTRIGLMANGSEAAGELVEAIASSPSTYTYLVYTDTEKLRADVSTGALDCGFIFDGRIEEIGAQHYENSYTFVGSAASTKSLMVKEEVFSLFLTAMSGSILGSLSDTIFVHPDAASGDVLASAFGKLVRGEEVLTVWFEDAETGERTNAMELLHARDGEAGAPKKGRPLSAVTALLLFAAALFLAAGRFRGDTRAVRKALRPGRRFAFTLADTWMPSLLLGLALLALHAFRDISAGSSPAATLLRCLLVLAAGVPLTALWSVLFAALFRRESTYLFAVIAVLMVSAVFSASGSFTVGILTRQVSYLRFLLPTTYLML